MQHYIYRIKGSDPDPIGTGDSKSWFYYYKWLDEGRTYLPDPYKEYGVNAGDRLWIVLYDVLVGTVPLVEVIVENESMRHASQEYWYEATEKRDLDVPLRSVLDDVSIPEILRGQNLETKLIPAYAVAKFESLLENCEKST